MMRARNAHEKEYVVSVDQEVTSLFLEKMSKGVYLKELNVTTRSCKITKTGKYEIPYYINSGLNRQIRRMCEACGAR